MKRPRAIDFRIFTFFLDFFRLFAYIRVNMSRSKQMLKQYLLFRQAFTFYFFSFIGFKVCLKVS